MADYENLHEEYSDEEIEVRETKERIERRYHTLDQLTADATQQGFVFDFSMLRRVNDTVKFIQEGYDDVCENYTKYEDGEISLDDYSQSLSRMMLDRVQKTSEIQKIFELLSDAKASQTDEKNQVLCDKFKGELMDVARLIDDINFSLMIYRWTVEASVSLPQDKSKIEDVYPQLKNHPHANKRALERKTKELYRSCWDGHFSNIKILDMVEESAKQLGFVYDPNILVDLRRQARDFDERVKDEAKMAEFKVQSETLMHLVHNLSMDQMRRNKLTKEISATRVNLEYLKERLEQEREKTDDVSKCAEELAKAYDKEKTKGWIKLGVGAVAGSSITALAYYLISHAL